jgi:hypothetical protein
VTSLVAPHVKSVGSICTEVETTLVRFGALTDPWVSWALIRGLPFVTVNHRVHTPIIFEGMPVDDHAHGMLLLNMGFTP